MDQFKYMIMTAAQRAEYDARQQCIDQSQNSHASVPADAARFNDGWTHSCNALCMEIALWIDRCPHCGRPAPKSPIMQKDKP